MRLLEAGLLVLGGGRRAMSLTPPSVYWSLGVCLSVESGWRVAGTSGSDVWEEDPDSTGRGDSLCHPVFSSQPSCPFLHCFLGWEIGANGFCLREGIHHPLPVCWRTCPPWAQSFPLHLLYSTQTPAYTDSMPSLGVERAGTHHPGTCLPLAWLTLAPPPSWLLEAVGDTSVTEVLSWEPL